MRERWPIKPHRGARCDITTGTTEDCCGSPVLVRCTNLAVETVVSTSSYSLYPLYVCADCRDQMVQDGLVRRNPKRKR